MLELAPSLPPLPRSALLLLFSRSPGEAWADTLAHAPVRLASHHLEQAEAGCFSSDGKQIYVASEGARALLRYDRR